MPWDLSVFQVMEILNPALPILHNRVWYHIVTIVTVFSRHNFCRILFAGLLVPTFQGDHIQN